MTVRTKIQIAAAKQFNVQEKNEYEIRLNAIFSKAVELNDLDYNQLDNEEIDLISSIKHLDELAVERRTDGYQLSEIRIRPIVNLLLQTQRNEFMQEVERLESLLPVEV